MPQHSESTRKGTVVPTAADVAAYLQANPNFLVENPELLETLNPPVRRNGDGVIDMQHFMLERLRKEVDRLRSYQSELINTTRTNQSVQMRIHTAAVSIIAADSFEKLINLVTREMAGLLDVDMVTLGVEIDGRDGQPATPGVMLLAPGSVDAVLGRGQQVRLRSGMAGDPAIFGPLAHEVQSAALVRIKPSSGAPDGVLAFGSRDPNGFSEDQSTELLFFLAQVLEHTIRAWLDLPA